MKSKVRPSVKPHNVDFHKWRSSLLSFEIQRSSLSIRKVHSPCQQLKGITASRFHDMTQGNYSSMLVGQIFDDPRSEWAFSARSICQVLATSAAGNTAHLSRKCR